MGISSYNADSGEEAADIIRRIAIHIAIVDLDIPLNRTCPTGSAGGGRILQILRRLETPPPTVIVRPPQLVARESARGLSEALRQGAFAVLDRPVNLETMLETMRRVLRRHYAGFWPGRTSTS
jgi:DNA-binding response OmpR family regulator